MITDLNSFTSLHNALRSAQREIRLNIVLLQNLAKVSLRRERERERERESE